MTSWMDRKRSLRLPAVIGDLGDPVDGGADVLGPLLLGDVPEAPDAADDPRLDLLGFRGPLERPAVLEGDDVGALPRRMGIQPVHLGQEFAGVGELGEDVIEKGRVLPRGRQVGGDAPHVQERLVRRLDPARPVDDQDAVGRGFQRRLEQGKGRFEGLFGLAPFGVAPPLPGLSERAGPLRRLPGGPGACP